MRRAHELIPYFQRLPSSQVDIFDGDIPLDSCLTDRPHRHGRYCSSDRKGPKRVPDCGIRIEAMKRDTQDKKVIKNYLTSRN